jgi:beta-glucosidase
MKPFFWGTATSSFQIEGGFDQGGRTPSIWDTYTTTPGKVRNNDDGRLGIDHFHQYGEDLSYLETLGVNSYRFSISWSRIIPSKDGQVNLEGLAFYDRILAKLETYGITPFVTLYHWDLPNYLQEIGGWENRETAYAFAAYTKAVVSHFGDRCLNYITINEPQCIINLGHRTLEHAPGIYLDDKRIVNAIHNLLLAHGLAVKAIRELNNEAKIGFAPTATSAIPLTNHPRDVEAARRSFFALNYGAFDGVILYSDPIFLGDYPKQYYDYYRAYLPSTLKEDLALISQPLDYCFQNFYTGYYVRALDNGNPIKVPYKPENIRGVCEWLYKVPESLYFGPLFLYERYKKPIIISENGVAVVDHLSKEHVFKEFSLVEENRIHDFQRIDYYQSYIQQLLKAKQEGVDIRGYFAWSLFDNFEWALGYEARFGLIYVDYKTYKRYPKDSFHFYKELIKNHQDI